MDTDYTFCKIFRAVKSADYPHEEHFGGVLPFHGGEEGEQRGFSAAPIGTPRCKAQQMPEI